MVNTEESSLVQVPFRVTPPKISIRDGGEVTVKFK